MQKYTKKQPHLQKDTFINYALNYPKMNKKPINIESFIFHLQNYEPIQHLLVQQDGPPAIQEPNTNQKLKKLNAIRLLCGDLWRDPKRPSELMYLVPQLLNNFFTKMDQLLHSKLPKPTIVHLLWCLLNIIYNATETLYNQQKQEPLQYTQTIDLTSLQTNLKANHYLVVPCNVALLLI